MLVLTQENSIIRPASLQELAGYVAMAFLVVLTWEVGKWTMRRLATGFRYYWSVFQRSKEASLLGVEKFSANGPDRWEVYSRAKFTVLIHHKPRQMLYDPNQAKLPFKKDLLSGVRITVVYYLSSKEYRFMVDNYSDSGRARYNLHQAWVGQTVLLLK